MKLGSIGFVNANFNLTLAEERQIIVILIEVIYDTQRTHGVYYKSFPYEYEFELHPSFLKKL